MRLPLLALACAALGITVWLFRFDGSPQLSAPPDPPATALSADAERLRPAGPAAIRVMAEESDPAPTDQPGSVEWSDRDLVSSIRILVLGPGRSPWSGATVFLAPTSGSDGVADGALEQQAVTAADGTATLATPESGRFTLHAEAPGHASPAAQAVVPGSSIVLLLHAIAGLDGILLDDLSGAPISGGLLLYENDRGVLDGQSGRDGRFHLSGLTQAGGRLEVLAAGYAAQKVWIEPHADLLSIRMQPAALLRGRLVDEEDRPVPGAAVRLLADRSIGTRRRQLVLDETSSAGDGTFQLAFGADEAEVVAEHPLALAASRWFDGVPEEAIEITLRRVAALVGRVETEDGRPLPGARLQLLGVGASGANQRLARSDATGSFRFDWVERGALRIAVWHPQATPSVIAWSHPGAGEPLIVQLAPAAGLRGSVRRQDGQPAPFATITLDAADPALLRASRQSGPLRADRDGRFEVRPIAPGSYFLRAELGAALSGDTPITVTAAGSHEILLTLDDAAITGVVVDADDRPIVAAEVVADAKVDERRLHDEATTDAEGRFRLSRYSPGQSITLRAEAEGFLRGDLEFTVQAGQPELRLALQPACDLRGRVVDAETARPIERFAIEVESAAGTGEETSTRKRAFLTADGSFRFEDFAAGTASVTVKADGYFRAGPQQIDIGPTVAPVTLRLHQAGEVIGRVIDGARRPLSGTFVSLTPKAGNAGEPAPRARKSRVRDDGGFRVREVTPGHYLLRVGQADAPEIEREIDVGLGITDVFDLTITRLGGIDLQVIGRSGRAVGKCDVVVEGRGLGTRRIARTADDGRVLIEPLLADEYDLTCADAHATVVVTSGTRSAAQLELPVSPSTDEVEK